MTQNEKIGQAMAELLNLKARRKDKRYNTGWGTKTLEGLGASVRRIVEENSGSQAEKIVDSLHTNESLKGV